MTTLTRRHDFVLIFDVTNGNPNGDPDAGNLPRLDPETNHGLVSDVSLKRKIRNYVELAREGEAGHHIYVQEGAILNEKHRKAYVALRPDDPKAVKDAKLNPRDDAEALKLRDFMCSNFFDVRTFGAVMSTGINCGQVKGPVQMTFASSVEPVLPVEISITRMAATNEAEQKKRTEGEDGDVRTDNRTMGRKHIVPYGLYVAHGFISAKFAERTGFSEADLDLLFEALANMFEHDRSAARGEMTTRMIDDWIREEGSPIQPASVAEHDFAIAAIISALNPGGDWFRSSGVAETGIELQRGEERRKVLLRFERGRLVLAKVGDEAIAIDDATFDGSRLALTRRGRTVKYAYHANGGQIAFANNGEVLVFEERLAPGSAREKSDPLRPVAPVTGLVTRVLVTAGAQVVEGAALAVIEAMKMETTVTAAVAGRVNIVHVVEGNQVSAGAAICEIRREGE